MFGIFTKKKRKKSKKRRKNSLDFFFVKSGNKSMDKKVKNALVKSNGKCVSCKKGKRDGFSLFCKRCHKKMNY